MLDKIKTFLKKNGIMGLGALAVAAGAMFFGWWFLFWGSLGFLIGKNWEIILALWEESKLKDKIEDKIDEVKEKF